MRTVNTEKIKEIVSDRWSDKDVRPLLMFKGALTESQARIRLNFLRSMMLAEIPEATLVCKLSKVEFDSAHLCGMHAKKGWPRVSMQTFFYRVLNSPSVLERVAGLREYLHWVIDSSHNFHPFFVTPISEVSAYPHQTSRSWRKRGKYEPVTEFYPFISQTPTEDHALLLAVDALVPRGLLNDVRADICQEMIVSILTGELTLENIRDCPQQHIKKLLKVTQPERYRCVSLDAPLFDGSKKTLGDTLVG